MTRRAPLIVGALLSGLSVGGACGEVTAWTTPDAAPDPAVQSFSGDRFSVSLQSTYQAGTTVLNIRGDADDIILNIAIAVETDQATWVVLHGDAGATFPIGCVDQLITDVRGQAQGTVRVVNMQAIELREMSAHSVVAAEIDDLVRGPVTVLDHQSFQGSIQDFIVGRVVSSSAGGDWLINGPVVNLEVVGTFGQAAFPVNLHAEAVFNMQVEGLFGSVDATLNDADGLISNLLVTGDSDAVITANQIATIHPSDVGIKVDGDLNQDIVIEGELVDQIVIGGSLGADIVIGADQGLLGQVIINETALGGSWNGEVRVANGATTIVLDEAEYADTSSNPAGDPYDLGGGAVGLVPFHLNNPETRVANASPDPMMTCPGEQDRFELVYCGPVADISSPTVMPVTIVREQLWCPFGQLCEEDVTDDYSSSVEGRVLVLTPDNCNIDCGYRYTITVDESVLVCDGTVALLSQGVGVAANEDDSFEIFCKTDLSRNGLTDQPDPVTWANEPVDLNDDGVADIADFQLIVDALE